MLGNSEFSWADLVSAVHPGNGDCYTELQPRQDGPAPPPAFIYGAMSADLARFYYNETVVHPVGSFTLINAGLTGDGFPTRNGTFLTAAAYGLSPDYITSQLPNGPPARVRRETGRGLCLSGPGYRIYGHWLTDILPKLYVLERLGIDVALETLALPVDTPQFGRDWLRLLKVFPRRVVTYDPANEVVQFDELILPLPIRANSRASHLLVPAVAALARRIGDLPARPPATDRIYLSRQKSGRLGRQVRNADALEQMAVANGFTIVHPELLSLPEQLVTLRHARMLMGEYGSALHGSMFAPPDCIVCAIRGTGVHPGFLQSGVCGVLGQPFGYVFGPTQIGPDGTQMIEPDVQDVAAALNTMNIMAAAQPRAA